MAGNAGALAAAAGDGSPGCSSVMRRRGALAAGWGGSNTRFSRSPPATSPAATRQAAAASRPGPATPSRQREDIQRPSLGRVARQVGHRAGEALAPRAIADVQVLRDHLAGPAADAR